MLASERGQKENRAKFADDRLAWVSQMTDKSIRCQSAGIYSTSHPESEKAVGHYAWTSAVGPL